MYILAISILFALGIALTTFPWFKKFRQTYSEAFSFIYITFGTFIGVFAALFFSNIEKESTNRHTAIHSARLASENLKMITTKASTYYLIYRDNVVKPKNHSANYFKKNPFPFPYVIFSLLSDSNFRRYLSYFGIGYLETFKGILDSMKADLIDDSLPIEKFATILKNYCVTLNYIQELLEIESMHIKEEIFEEELTALHSFFLWKFSEGQLGENPKSERIKQLYTHYLDQWENWVKKNTATEVSVEAKKELSESRGK